MKWFCGPIDAAVPPRPPGEVLASMWLSLGIVFPMLIAAGALLDTASVRCWAKGLPRHRHFDVLEETVIRVGVAGYAVCLWNRTAMVPWGNPADSVVLTPELLGGDRVVSLLQFLVAVLLVFRRTCPFAGLSLGILFGIGLIRYGVFHMTDYLFFLGLAAYLVLGAPQLDRRPEMRAWRVPLLTASLSVSLMWTAIEKFLYPQWTEVVVTLHPAMAFGFPTPFVVGVAGFVEFSLAFYLLVGRALLRLDAVLFMAVFVSAIPEFGILDRVGHLPIIAILLVVALHGPSAMQNAVASHLRHPARAVAIVTGLYCGVFATLMALYYGLQSTAGWF